MKKNYEKYLAVAVIWRNLAWRNGWILVIVFSNLVPSFINLLINWEAINVINFSFSEASAKFSQL